MSAILPIHFDTGFFMADVKTLGAMKAQQAKNFSPPPAPAKPTLSTADNLDDKPPAKDAAYANTYGTVAPTVSASKILKALSPS
jgi:hypothetical protein